MKRRFVLGAAVLCSILAGSAEASAAGDANGMGQKGQLIVSADRLFSLFNFTSFSVTRTVNGNSVTQSQSGSSMALLWGQEETVLEGGGRLTDPHTVPRLAIDFTVIDRLTLGGTLVLAFGLGGSTEVKAGNTTSSTDSPTTTVFGIAPRVGYIIPVGEVLAIWPRGGFSFYSQSTKSKDTQNNNTVTTSVSGSQFSLDLDPVLAIVPIPHLFFTVGPLVNIPLTGTFKTTVENGANTVERSDDLSIFHFGIAAGMGGWFNL